MESFPNLPPPPPKPSQYSGPPIGVRKAAGPAAADATPDGEAEPAQVPLDYGGEQIVGEFMTEDQFIEQYVEERNPFPSIVLGIGLALCYIIYAGFGFYQGGAAEAIAMGIMVSVMLAVACTMATGVGWLVCKIFGDDIDSVITLFLRFSSVAAFQIAVFTGLMLAVGFFPALVFSAPLMVVIVVYVGGMDMLRAIVFTVVLSLVNFALVSFFAVGTLGAALQP